MPITHGHSYLVAPSSDPDNPPIIGGAQLDFGAGGKLIEMLKSIYEQTDDSSAVEVTFRPTDGRQENACRTLLLSYLTARRKLDVGRHIARRLQEHTTFRSKVGLLFIVCGTTARGVRLVVARFPADQGVMADARGETLELEFIEQVFMRTSFHYKSVVYNATSAAAGFWNGFAVDKQSPNDREGATYWISGFLDSVLSATAAHGAKWTAAAFRAAIQHAPNADVRGELVAASQAIRGQHQRRVSISSVAEALGMSIEAQDAMKAGLPREELFTQQFRFDREEYDRHIQLRMVSLDNGATLIADNQKFDSIFQTQAVRGQGRKTRFATEGEVVSERLRKRV